MLQKMVLKRAKTRVEKQNRAIGYLLKDSAPIQEIAAFFPLTRILEKIKPNEREELLCRWVAGRAFFRQNDSRRLSKNYEITSDSAITIVKISHNISPASSLVNSGFYCFSVIFYYKERRNGIEK